MTGNIYESFADILAGQQKILDTLSDLKTSSQSDKVYELTELVSVLSVSRRTISAWIKEGILPHSKVGNKIWVTEEQLNSFLEKHSNTKSDLNL